MSLWAWREIFSPDKKVKPGGQLGYFKGSYSQAEKDRSERAMRINQWFLTIAWAENAMIM